MAGRVAPRAPKLRRNLPQTANILAASGARGATRPTFNRLTVTPVIALSSSPSPRFPPRTARAKAGVTRSWIQPQFGQHLFDLLDIPERCAAKLISDDNS